MHPVRLLSRRPLATLLAAATLALALPGTAGAAAPDMVQGALGTASIPVGPKVQEIARLDVGPGTWIAFATLTVRMNVKPHPTTVCGFRSSGAIGIDQHILRGSRYVDALEQEPFSHDLDGIAGGTFNGSGAFVLVCRSDLAGPKAEAIRIVALKVPDLAIRSIPVGQVTTAGSDDHALLVKPDTAVTLDKGVWTPIVKVDLPTGQWSLHGSLTAIGAPASLAMIPIMGVSCRLQLAGDSAASRGYVYDTNSRMLAMDLAGAVSADHSPQRATLQCRADANHVRISGARLAVLRVGALHRIDAMAGEGQDDGTGDPDTFHQRGANDPIVDAWAVKQVTKVASFALPGGRWLARATFGTAFNSATDTLPKGSLSCTLDGGAAQDVHVSARPAEDATFSMMVPVKAGASSAPLRCSLPAATTGTMRIADLRMTLIAVGDVTTDDLTQ